MIKIKCLNGPHIGKVRHFVGPLNIETGQILDNPMELLASMIAHGDIWEIDYSRATDEEIFIWLRSDLVNRAIRAFKEGRPVKFLNRTFIIKEGDDPMEIIGAFEDAVADSGRLITIESDDERGFVVGVAGYEH